MWKTSDVTQKMKKAFMDERVGLGLSEQHAAEYTAHCIRTTVASEMAKGGKQVSVISTALGHRGQSVTQDHYIQHSREDVREALATVGRRRGDGGRK